MVSDEILDSLNEKLKDVLILVLMEYGLWPPTASAVDAGLMVLILVLMEYGLWLAAA